MLSSPAVAQPRTYSFEELGCSITLNEDFDNVTTGREKIEGEPGSYLLRARRQNVAFWFLASDWENPFISGDDQLHGDLLRGFGYGGGEIFSSRFFKIAGGHDASYINGTAIRRSDTA